MRGRFGTCCLAVTGIVFLFCLAQFSIADEEVRTWTSSNGEFQVNAKLVAFKNGKASLLKEDGLTVDVPLDSLCSEDQAYLKQYEKNKNPFAGGSVRGSGNAAGSRGMDESDDKKPAKELSGNIKELTKDGRQIFLESNERIGPTTADPMPYQVKFAQYTRTFQKTNAYCRFSMPILVDPEQPAYAVSIHQDPKYGSGPGFGHIYIAGTKDRTPKLVYDSDKTIHLLDHHIKSGRSLTAMGMAGPSSRGGALILSKNLMDGKGEVVSIWNLPDWDRPGFKPKIETAKLLDEKRAIVVVNESLFVWDLVSGKLECWIERAGRNIQISPTGKYVAIPTREGATIVGIEETAVLGKIPFGGVVNLQVSFSHDGSKLALIAGNEFGVWDFEKAAMISQGNVGSVTGAMYGWVDDSHFVCQLGGLIDIDLGISVWSYGTLAGGNVHTVPGGVVMVGDSQACKLVSMELPHEPAKKMIDLLNENKGDLLVMSPDSSVNLKIGKLRGIDEDEMGNAALEMVRRTGWKLDKNADTTVEVQFERGKEDTYYFRSLLARPWDRGEPAKLAPVLVSVRIVRDGKVIWAHRKSEMFPAALTQQRGKTLQQTIDQYKNGYPGYFKVIHLPAVKPEIANGKKRSTLRDGQWRT